MELYRNLLAGPGDLEGFVVEGDAAVTFPQGRLRLESRRDPAEGQAANLVLWCPEALPDGVEISWDFWPVREPGLAILFFGARGRGGEGVLAPSLAPRTGPYEQYHSGDIDAYHVSYFRRMWASERRFHTCNLRKSHGFHLVAQGPDPLPSVLDAAPPYRVSVTLSGGRVAFSIDGLRCLEWVDDGALGPVLGAGHIGFRQMAPLIAEYANLTIRLMENPETT